VIFVFLASYLRTMLIFFIRGLIIKIPLKLTGSGKRVKIAKNKHTTVTIKQLELEASQIAEKLLLDIPPLKRGNYARAFSHIYHRTLKNTFENL
jgi:hypothetical protein